MKSLISNIILTFVAFLIAAVLFLFGLVGWQYIQKENTPEVKEYEGVYTQKEVPSNSTTDEEIKTPTIISSTIDKLTGKTPEKVEYDQIEVDNYFYNQLEVESKIIYRGLQSNLENLKSGTYRIEFGETFSDLLAQENGQETLGDYYQSAIEAFTYDNPSVFFLSPNKMFLNIEKSTSLLGTQYNVFIDNGSEPSYLADAFQSQEDVNYAIAQVEEVKNYLLDNKASDTYDNIRLVHDYLVETIDYDTSISEPNIYDVYGAFIRRKCVCEGYARAFKYVMDEMGIPCVLVIGEATNTEGATENHAWNYVYLDENWYAVDATWDDPVVYGGGKPAIASKYKYLLKGSSTTGKDHRPNGQFTPGGKVFEYPMLSSMDY